MPSYPTEPSAPEQARRAPLVPTRPHTNVAALSADSVVCLAPSPPDVGPLPSDARHVLALLQAGPQSIDALAGFTQLPIHQMCQLIAELCSAAYVTPTQPSAQPPAARVAEPPETVASEAVTVELLESVIHGISAL